MAVYAFRGVDASSGKNIKGYRDAESPRALRAVLRREGVLLTQANEEAQAKAKSRSQVDLFAFFKRPTPADVAVMTRQLATLVRAGIPLVESISALVDQIEKESMQKVLTAVREDLREGTAFAKALGYHPKVFPPLYVNMVAAGEASGTLESVLERLADFMEDQSELKGKVTAAMAYPVLMSIIAGLIVAVLMVTVVPKVTSIFEHLGKELPWYTRFLIGVSGFLSTFWWVILLLSVGGFYGFRRWVATPEGRLSWDSFQLRMPLFGRLNQLVALARFSRTLATLLASGVPLLAAMDIVKNVLGNRLLESVVKEAISSIREGESIAEPLKRSGHFPSMVTHMIAVGEKSGQLEQMLENVSKAYESDVETKLQVVTSMLGPLVIVVMGIMVAFIVMSIMMPLVQMNDMV
jgi:general secretion pathway protein F